MKTLFLCLMLCALEASAQRIVPVEAKVDSGWVKEMVEFNGKLVMAGRFAGMNGIPARNILAWDGGSGVDDLGIHISGPGVNTLSRFQNGVVFDGGVAPLSHVYFWNGDTTVIIGTAELGIITSTAVFNGVLYAAGGFTTMDGIDARHIAKWDGSAWSPVGAGFNDRVVAMEVYNGSLFIGGYFTSSGDSIQSLLHVARWDGTVMHGVDSGVNGSIRALAAQPGALWLAGDFQVSGDSTVVLPHFAQCTDTVIVPLISDATAQNTSTPGMLVDLGEYGILTRADIWNERVYANGAWRKAFLRSIYCACTFQGTTYVGGVMEGRQAPDYLETDLALCKLLPGTGQVELNVAGISA